MSFFGGLLGLDTPKIKTVDTAPYMSAGKDFLNPQSSVNRGMFNNLKQMGIDAAAQQYMQGARMQAMGQNPFAQDQWKSALSNNLGQTQNAYSGYLNNAYGIGSSLLGQALQGNLANAQARNMANMNAQNNKSDFWGGLFANALGAAPSFLFPEQKKD
jgi:hypothetical protein